MNTNNIIIRLERKDEQRAVENLVRESFWNVYRPGCLEHFVLNQLRDDEAFVSDLDFVMELDGQIIGQNIFVKAEINADDGRNIPIMTMGPICITPELKRKGYGKILLDYSLEKAKELGCGALCFEGNIDFYGKSDFTYASEFIGTPIWNSKGVPAINSFLSDESICQKVTGLIITSGGGDIEKCVKALEEKIPNVKYQISLLDRKHKDYGLNDNKIKEFIESINA